MKIRKNGRRLVLSVVATVLCLGLVTSVTISVLASTETEYDLTTDPSGLGTVTINGAIWEIFQPTDPTGSGVFQSFFREQASGTERGYNTDGRPLQFDELKSKTFTRSVLLADVPQVKVGDVIYREFQLDINENKSDPDWYISLDEFQVWVTNNAELLGYDESARSFAAGTAELVYDLDVGIDGESMIKMDFRANPGSGKRDYRVFVPESNFEGKIGMYCVIFARHGDAYTTDDGYEEWGVAVYPATKAGYKFHDLNYNGIWDDGEPGLKGWTINLKGTDGMGSDVDLSTTTDDGGYYEFANLKPGTYTVSEVLKDETWFQSYPADPGTYEVTLKSGDDDKGNNFGNYQQADLSIDKTGKITYTIKVYNDGPSPALNVVVEDKLPGNLTWEISSSSGFTTITIDSGTLKGTIDSLAAGASAWVTVEADIDGDWENSPLPNTATTKSITPDPNESNNEDDADIPPVS